MSATLDLRLRSGSVWRSAAGDASQQASPAPDPKLRSYK